MRQSKGFTARAQMDMAPDIPHSIRTPKRWDAEIITICNRKPRQRRFWRSTGA